MSPPGGCTRLRGVTFPPPGGCSRLHGVTFPPPGGCSRLHGVTFSLPGGCSRLHGVTFSLPGGCSRLHGMTFSLPEGMLLRARGHFFPPWGDALDCTRSLSPLPPGERAVIRDCYRNSHPPSPARPAIQFSRTSLRLSGASLGLHSSAEPYPTRRLASICFSS